MTGNLYHLDSVFAVLDHVDLLLQVDDQTTKVEWVHVLGEKVEEEPVADAAVLQHLLDLLWIGDAAVGVGGDDAHARVEDGQGAVDEGEGAGDGEEVEPEPEEDVHLLVDDVDRQNAHRIVALHVTGGTVSVECTLGQAGEHFDLGGGKYINKG